MHYVTVDGQKYTHEEFEEIRKREQEKQRSEQEEASRLVREAGEAFRRAQQFIQSRPQLVRQVGDADAVEHELFEKLRKNLDRADDAPRCEKVREDGTTCGSPRMNGHNYCYAHERMLQARARKLELPPLEDGNSIQMALMLVQRALIDDEISVKKAGLLLYSLQTAACNLKNTTFCEAEDEYLVTEMPSEETEGEKVARGKTVWTSQYENSTTETQRHGEGVSRRFSQMNADGEKDTAEGGCATRDSQGHSNSNHAKVSIGNESAQARVPVPHKRGERLSDTAEGGCATRDSHGLQKSHGVEHDQMPDAAEGGCAPQSKSIGMGRVSPLDLGMDGEGERIG